MKTLKFLILALVFLLTASTTLAQTGTCIGDSIIPGKCLIPGQALCSLNGCFKMVIEGGNLVTYRTSDNSILWRSMYTNGQMTKACSVASPPKFDITPMVFNYGALVVAKLTDYGQLVFITGGTTQNNNFGIGSSCTGNNMCSESIIDVGQCITPGQWKVSCNGCFKMTLQNGNLAVYHNIPTPGNALLVYSLPNAQKACGEADSFKFYSSTNQQVFFIKPENSNGVLAKILDNGQIVFAAKNSSYSYIYTIGNPKICFNPSSFPCIGDSINPGQCLSPGQALCSQNGCFKMVIEGGNLATYRTSDKTVIWKSLTTNSQATKACSVTTPSNAFAASPLQINYGSPTVAKLSDNGQLNFITANITQSNNFGVGSTCTSNAMCTESLLDFGQCMTTNQSRVSCNGCFKMVFEKGTFVVYYNNAPGLPPVFTFVIPNNQAVKVCGEANAIRFYSSTNAVLFTAQPNNNNAGVFAKILDNGQIAMAAKNLAYSYILTYGSAKSCYVTTTTSTTTTTTTTLAPVTYPPMSGCSQSIIAQGECLYPGQVKISCNGCFKMSIKNGDLVFEHNTNVSLPPIENYNYTNGQTAKICAGTDYQALVTFYSATGQNIWNIAMGIAGISSSGVDARLMDDGRLYALSRNLQYSMYTGRSATCYVPTTTTSTTTLAPVTYPPMSGCSQSIIAQGECLYPGQVKISCNGCFKMSIKNGNLVFEHNTDVLLPPIENYNYTNGQTAKICAGTDYQALVTFYSATGQNIWNIAMGIAGISSSGVDARLMDDGRLYALSRNLQYSMYTGRSATCYVPPVTTTTTTTTTPTPTTFFATVAPVVPTCAANTIPYNSVFYANQTLVSCNGQYKVKIQGNYAFVGFNSSDTAFANPIWRSVSINTPVGAVYTRSQLSVIAADPMEQDTWNFGPLRYGLNRPYDIKLCDDGRLVFIDKLTGTIIPDGLHCIPNGFTYGSCISEGQTLYTCEKCFRLVFLNGNLTIHSTNDLTRPLWVSKTSPQGAVKACLGNDDKFTFYNSANVALTAGGIAYFYGNNGQDLNNVAAGASVVNGVSPYITTLRWANLSACRDFLRVPVL